MITLDKSLTLFLGTLKHVANTGCEKAKGIKECFDEAVNWGDLGCVEARYVVNELGEEHFHVIVEEADPACSKLQAYLRDYLCDRIPGTLNIEVTTEW